jgi:hypothetical protein
VGVGVGDGLDPPEPDEDEHPCKKSVAGIAPAIIARAARRDMEVSFI